MLEKAVLLMFSSVSAILLGIFGIRIRLRGVRIALCVLSGKTQV